MFRPFVLGVSLALAGSLLAMPGGVARAQTGAQQSAATGIHRCVGPDGRLVFTDRGCEDSGAIEQPAPSAAAGNVRIAVRSCARTREELLWGVRSALEARDVNRFAAYYHWPGMATADAYRLMDRLSAFSERPLVDAQLLSSADLHDSAAPAEPVDAPEQTSAEQSLGIAPPAASPPAPVSHAPDLLRVDQMLSGNNAAAQVTYFRLQPYAGCWWIRY
jgi:hypothetical protein